MLNGCVSETKHAILMGILNLGGLCTGKTRLFYRSWVRFVSILMVNGSTHTLWHYGTQGNKPKKKENPTINLKSVPWYLCFSGFFFWLKKNSSFLLQVTWHFVASTWVTFESLQKTSRKRFGSRSLRDTAPSSLDPHLQVDLWNVGDLESGLLPENTGNLLMYIYSVYIV